ncbi:hypothetical protein F5Y18DRAFT_378317 [Xylariaceae sp. FL1019]|nr:hypothetical protein F5Y18DRAFT_378317 [Xylariaceae sp. FL1019]
MAATATLLPLLSLAVKAGNLRSSICVACSRSSSEIPIILIPRRLRVLSKPNHSVESQQVAGVAQPPKETEILRPKPVCICSFENFLTLELS